MIDQFRDESLTLTRPEVLILGASTRAAAMSALRAGFQPVCVDQFADADLRQLVRVETVETLSISGESRLRRLLSEHSDLPVVATGGVENHLPLVQLLETAPHQFWGASSSAIAQVRDPIQLAVGLQELKQRMLEVRASGEPPDPDGTWVIKPIWSAGGRNIRVWQAGTETPSGDYFFQKRVEGEVYSALFLAESQPGDVRFVGLTRQLVSCPELDAPEFAWCGNIGPVFLPVETEFLVRRWGNILKWKFQLTGLFGIDFMVDQSGQAWLLEVNPRLTASVEVLELACGVSLFADHVACYAPQVAQQAWEFASPPWAPGGDRLGRAILYAGCRTRSQLAVPDLIEWETSPGIADIPDPGSIIEAGQPICSVYAWGNDEAEVRSRLFDRVHELRRHLTPCV